LLAVVVVGALAFTYFGWFRDSSLVGVREVKVEDVSSRDRDQIVAALTDAAHQMTTLHVQTDRLAASVEGFPAVASVSASADFPHGLTIHVTQRKPALLASDGSHQMPVAADGSLLPGVDVGGRDLPVVNVGSLPASGRLGGEGLEEALVAGAAPVPLRALIARMSYSPDYGVVATMHGGIDLRFGTHRQAGPKWEAVAAILADPKLTSLSYVNVRVPGRPAVG
jgi:cell division protein FtsQ